MVINGTLFMNTTSFSVLKRLLSWMVLILMCGALMPAAHAQNNLKPSVVVIDELVLPPIDADGNAFFDLPAPGHLTGADKGRYHAHFVLAPNTNVYSFVADASGTTGSNSVPLEFQWSYFIGDETAGDFFPVFGPTTSPFYTNNPVILSNSNSREIVLDVDNGHTTERLWLGIQVLTPQQATDAMIDWIHTRYPKPTSRAQRKLLPPLRAASAHFAAGETQLAKDQLNLFFKRVKLSRLPLTGYEARVFKSLTRTIIATAAD
jgi:hypothetical protein